MRNGAGTLSGKVAIVTGAGQGVGRGVALALAAEGATIAVLGRTERKLEKTCTLIRERGAEAEPFVCDVADTAAVPEVVGRIAERFGGIDILVNNAYSGAFGPLLERSEEHFQEGFRTGPFAAFAFMKACHPHMKARGGGNIVNLVTSAMVRWDPSTYGAYAAAKQALRSLTRTAAAEWGPDGIRANSVAPHALSPGLKWWIKEFPEEAAEFRKTIPLGYIGECEEDIGRAVAALVGPSMRYLTGATIPLDGGQANFG
jgi:NAD(P)-dependent dehydrogenase (short-subunit alcohol dehydrogenase family)